MSSHPIASGSQPAGLAPSHALRNGLIVLAALTLAMGAMVIGQVVLRVQSPDQAASSPAGAPGIVAREPDPLEYVIFFDKKMDPVAQRKVLERYPELIVEGPGKLPGVMVFKFKQEPGALLQALRSDPEMGTVLKATKDMICH